MEETILSITTPTARKEHVCAVCGKPIGKGEKYFNVAIKADGRIVSRKTHYTCHYSEEAPLSPAQLPKPRKELGKVTLVVDELAKSKVPVTEEQFEKLVKDDVKTMLETFSFEESMQIAFVPLLLTEIAWHYAEKVVRFTVEQRIQDTVRLTRSVKTLRKEYLADVRISLSDEKINYIIEKAEEFMSNNAKHFTVLWWTCRNALLNGDWGVLKYTDMRTDAYLAAVMCEWVKRNNKKIARMIEERTGTYFDYMNPKTDALRSCMEAYVSPAEVKIKGHFDVALNILFRLVKDIEFGLV